MGTIIISDLAERAARYIAWSGLAVAAVMVSPAFASAATLSLSPTSGSHAAGSTFEVKINLDTTGTTTSGTDAYIRYDPNTLQVVDSNSGTEGTQILPGSLYSQTSYNSVDTTTGKISFSGSKSGGSPGYNGSGTLATITFSAVKEATGSQVTFDFTNGSTTDSNVIDQSSSDDVLASVTNASFTIGAGSDSSGDGSGSTDDGSGSGANGKGGTDGTGGTTDIAATGIDLNGYLLLTILSMVGAAYFLTRRPKTR
jgi:hypothetical protein